MLLQPLKLSFIAICTAVVATSCGANEEVYICTGPQSKVYHKWDDCRGLYNCSASVDQVSLIMAKIKGRRACRICVF